MTNEVAEIIQSRYWGTGSEWLWAFGQFVVVAATLILIARQVFFIAKQVKLQTRQTEIETMSHVVQAVCTIQERWYSETMQRVRLDVCSNWENDKREFDGACEFIALYFEELGTFVKINAIPEETMWDVQSWNLEYYWFMFEKGIAKYREECKEPVYCEFERLFRVMRKISDGKNSPAVDGKSLAEFVKREIRMTKACLDQFQLKREREEQSSEPLFRWSWGGSNPAPGTNRLELFRHFTNEGGAVSDLEAKAEGDVQASITPKVHLREREEGKIVFSKHSVIVFPDIRFEISYTTRLGKRSTQSFSWPSSGEPKRI